ncbi:hypothetical protein [Phenylobacterium sp.]|uniref:hypothetical protein n=1 Tax=Phenylobacterium sp. TaxID=1871053 RepID=UPI0035B48BA4
MSKLIALIKRCWQVGAEFLLAMEGAGGYGHLADRVAVLERDAARWRHEVGEGKTSTCCERRSG